MGKVWVDMFDHAIRADVIANYEDYTWSGTLGLERSDYANTSLSANLLAEGLAQHGFVGRTIYRVDFRWRMSYPEGGVWATLSLSGYLPPWDNDYNEVIESSTHTIEFIAELAEPYVIGTNNIYLGTGAAAYGYGSDTLIARVRLQRFLVEMDAPEVPCRWHRHRFTAEEC